VITPPAVAQDWANEWQVGDMHVSQVRAGAAEGGVAAYFLIHKHGAATGVLVSVVAVDGGAAQLRTTSAEADVTQVVEHMEIAAESTLVLEPGGNHVLISGLTAAPTAGDQLRLALQFDVGPAITITLPVLTADEASGTTRGTGHGH
ncbi:MAG: copper chaperone PCu(A)C, partial [Alphaproteobacteria bacterium]